MDRTQRKSIQRTRRHRRVRKKIVGVPDRPRLCVFRSAKHMYVQAVDDTQGKTLAAASTLKIGKVAADKKLGRKSAAAREVGKILAETLKEKGITKVRFDRGGYQYHGRVAALADGARSAGLEF